MVSKSQSFSELVLNWFDIHGRHDLPWQKKRNPYRVWVSEIMLQQTQVKTVIPYYQKFISAFPTLSILAAAPIDEVLRHWAGLGYYTRARNLHKSAVLILEDHAGRFPKNYDDVLALPGIGPSTAGAILAQALNQRHAILDGNVKRVLSRYHAIEGWPGTQSVIRLLWDKAEAHTPNDRVDDYTQAIMDLGATVCMRSKPDCEHCPVVDRCKAYLSDSIALFPTKRAKKALPVKQVRLLIIKDKQGAVLLEKRPPTGIWGGLWSLPELNPKLNISEEGRLRWGFQLENISDEQVFRHTFSHYHLDIQPSQCEIGVVDNAVRSNDGLMWCKTNGVLPAVAAPVAKILLQLSPL